MFSTVQIGLELTLVATTASSSRADALFNIWVEAPAQVIAGESFTASVWGEVSGSILDDSDGGFYFVAADVLAVGEIVQFSTAIFPIMTTPWDDGTPDENSLRGVVGLNNHWLLSFDSSNPLRLFDVEISTTINSIGQLDLFLAPSENQPEMLAWYLDHGVGSIVVDTDPGSSRIITPATVQVVPAPSALGLLAFAGLGARSRRRRSDGDFA